jgi:hypothetical protein
MVDPTPKPSAAAAPEHETEPGDPAALAERFLDLWQDQLAAIATDPDLAELVARLWGQWLVGPAAWRTPAAETPARPAARARTRAAKAADEKRPDPAGAEAPGAAAAAAAPRDHGPDVGDLLARLGTLEKRLAALERPPRVRSRAAERRTRRR